MVLILHMMPVISSINSVYYYIILMEAIGIWDINKEFVRPNQIVQLVKEDQSKSRLGLILILLIPLLLGITGISVFIGNN